MLAGRKDWEGRSKRSFLGASFGLGGLETLLPGTGVWGVARLATGKENPAKGHARALPTAEARFRLSILPRTGVQVGMLSRNLVRRSGRPRSERGSDLASLPEHQFPNPFHVHACAISLVLEGCWEALRGSWEAAAGGLLRGGCRGEAAAGRLLLRRC